MTPQDINTIKNYPFHAPVKIMLSKGETEIGERFSTFCKQLKEAAAHLTIRKESDIVFEDPVMVIGRHENIAYYALPTGKILPPFLEALDHRPATGQVPDENAAGALATIDLPVGLKLYIADQCPHCPKALRQIQEMAASTAMIRLRVINAELFTEMAEKDHVRSVPTLILEDRFRWTGQVDAEELLKICVNRDPSELSADSLRQLIEDGRAAQVATMMADSQQIFPALTDLLIHPRWSVRLGAMVAVEYLADEAPHLGLSLCQSLWQTFAHQQVQAQGDLTHIFGLFNDKMTRDYLQAIAAGDFADEVKDAAAEELAEIGA
ncbi:MAG: thioredoxin family protein [Desulfobacteraceae bacterium]